MGSGKKSRVGATPEEMLLLIAKAEEKSSKKNKDETKTEKDKSGHHNIKDCKEGKDIAGAEAQEKTNKTTKAKTKEKNEEKSYTKQIKKENDKSSKNIKRGASPEEMLQLIAKAEERIAKEEREKASIEDIITTKTEENLTSERKNRHSYNTPSIETKKSFIRIFRDLLHLKIYND